MIDFEVSSNEELGAFVIRGDFDPKAIAIAIPEDNQYRKTLSDYFLHKADFESSIRYLCCVSIDKPLILNEALFIASLNGFLKCFKQSAARGKLKKDDLFGEDEKALEELKHFEALRDKHFMHDENGMTQTTEFLLLNTEDNPKKLEQACVIWNKAPIDYYSETERLKGFVNFTYQKICACIDAVGKKIIDAYSELSRKELLGFGDPKVTIASTQNISKNRIQ